MFNDGFTNITNIDFSNTAVRLMEERFKINGYPMIYKHMDALDMKEFNSEEFNTIIDKGTLDSVLCGENGIPSAEKMLKEVQRILVKGGVFICISYGDENQRRSFFVILF